MDTTHQNSTASALHLLSPFERHQRQPITARGETAPYFHASMNNQFERRFLWTALALLFLLLGASSNLIDAFLESSNDDVFSLQPCPAICLDLEYSKPTGARLFYLILVHNERTEADAIHLFRAIRDPRNIIVIHYDRKVKHLLETTRSSPSVLLQEVNSCPCGSTVRVESVYSVEWSKWSMNLPTLWGLEVAATDFRDQWDVFINLSGDTMPVYTAETMAGILESLPYNFVTSRSCETGLLPTEVYVFPRWWHKRRHYTSDETEEDPVFVYQSANTQKQHNKTVITHFGSQWVILQRKFVHWLVEQLRDEHSWVSQFREHLIASKKLMTDETFLPTVLIHANDTDDDGAYDFSKTLPLTSSYNDMLLFRNGTESGITDVRYERMDEHYPSAFGVFPENQRYQVPEKLVKQNVLDQPRVWGPYFLGVYDLREIRETGAFLRAKYLH